MESFFRSAGDFTRSNTGISNLRKFPSADSVPARVRPSRSHTTDLIRRNRSVRSFRFSGASLLDLRPRGAGDLSGLLRVRDQLSEPLRAAVAVEGHRRRLAQARQDQLQIAHIISEILRRSL